MPKIVILGSCRFEPYDIIAVPERLKEGHTEEGYIAASKKFYPAIDVADEVWVYAPEGIGEHTQRDLEYAIKKRKRIRLLIGMPEKGKNLKALMIVPPLVYLTFKKAKPKSFRRKV